MYNIRAVEVVGVLKSKQCVVCYLKSKNTCMSPPKTDPTKMTTEILRRKIVINFQFDDYRLKCLKLCAYL